MFGEKIFEDKKDFNELLKTGIELLIFNALHIVLYVIKNDRTTIFIIK